MPALTITAVNTEADTLVVVGHGMLTGQRFRLRNIGGALPAATPALAPVTDYFAIRLTADTFQVAVSSGDASTGTAVDITGAGTGMQLLEYGLPYCVPRIAANLTQIVPEDDNAAWQALVALYDLLTGQAQSVYDGVTLAANLAVGGAITTPAVLLSAARPLHIPGCDFVLDAGSASRAGNIWTFPTAGTNRVIASFRIPPGAVISEARWSINRNSNNLSGEFQLQLVRESFGDGGTTTASIVSEVRSSGTGWTSVVNSSGLPHAVLDNALYKIAVTTSANFSGAPAFQGARLLVDRL